MHHMTEIKERLMKKAARLHLRSTLPGEDQYKETGLSSPHLASLIEFSEDAIIGKTPDGIIFSWNLGAEKIYGYTVEEVKGKSISILVPPELQKKEVSGILQKIKRGEHIDHLLIHPL